MVRINYIAFIPAFHSRFLMPMEKMTGVYYNTTVLFAYVVCVDLTHPKSSEDPFARRLLMYC